ncbi:MAG: hypothetical protein UY21_C0009G0091 [Microgenomates group bacterium GW2011_GWA1_48_10]|nr:MAG: hypothetical protein UY21_C0009G0091 [Microgenomates group bacterium GW2011_GWA1_48_10]
MKDLLLYLTRHIVTNPDAVTVEETASDQGFSSLTLTVDPQDMGKIIGREGRIIKALRDLVKVLAVKKGLKTSVLLKE